LQASADCAALKIKTGDRFDLYADQNQFAIVRENSNAPVLVLNIPSQGQYVTAPNFAFLNEVKTTVLDIKSVNGGVVITSKVSGVSCTLENGFSMGEVNPKE
jgi:hypothetical protein